MRSLIVAGVLVVTAVACSSSSDAPGATPGADGGSSSGDGGPGADASAPAGSYTVQFGPVDVAPGEESTKCMTMRLGNPAAMHVSSVHNVLSNGSHHMIVYRVNDTEEQKTPFKCQPFTDTLDPTKGSTLMISQKHDDALVLPEGVAYTVGANQMVRLEMHYINPGAAPIQVQATSTFIPLDDAKFQYEADFLFIGTPDINLPPMSTGSVGPMFVKLPAEYDDVNFFAITGHEHQYGKDVQVSTAAAKGDTGTPVYKVPGWLWSEPATVQANPPFKVPAGGGFNLTCRWQNTSDKAVSFGESANDEMCFFWAYYYPSKGGAKVCVHTEQGGRGLDACCPGNSPVCAYLNKSP
ncbi:MAG: hypothetical protein JWP97_289 [Labilithrix sp.]|nr:hypothetical protein [Labilithrix sp.]